LIGSLLYILGRLQTLSQSTVMVRFFLLYNSQTRAYAASLFTFLDHTELDKHTHTRTRTHTHTHTQTVPHIRCSYLNKELRIALIKFFSQVHFLYPSLQRTKNLVKQPFRKFSINSFMPLLTKLELDSRWSAVFVI
jgi:hypothetical protein